MKISKHIYLVGSGAMGFDWTHPSDCNVYLIDSGEGLILVDTGTGQSIEQIKANIQEHGLDPADINWLFLTHLHADHAGGAREWREQTGAKVVLLEKGVAVLEEGMEERIDLPQARKAGFYPQEYTFSSCPVDFPVNDGQEWMIGHFDIQVIATPGHSAFDTSYWLKGKDGSSILISGDTVFFGGKISMLSTSDFNLLSLAQSMDKLSQLPVDLLLPGHGQPALRNGLQHIQKAHHIFQQLGVPESIV